MGFKIYIYFSIYGIGGILLGIAFCFISPLKRGQFFLWFSYFLGVFFPSFSSIFFYFSHFLLFFLIQTSSRSSARMGWVPAFTPAPYFAFVYCWSAGALELMFEGTGK